jgi:hypothetical protein
MAGQVRSVPVEVAGTPPERLRAPGQASGSTHGLTLDELSQRSPLPPAPQTRIASKISPAALLRHVLRDELAAGRVDYDGHCYRLNPERFDPRVLAALSRLGLLD